MLSSVCLLYKEQFCRFIFIISFIYASLNFLNLHLIDGFKVLNLTLFLAIIIVIPNILNQCLSIIPLAFSIVVNLWDYEQRN